MLRILQVLMCLLLPLPLLSWAQPPSAPRVAFIASNKPGFWISTRELLKHVSEDLGVELRVFNAETRFDFLNAMQAIVDERDSFDYVMFTYPQQTGVQMMRLAEQAQLPFVLINSGVPEAEQTMVGKPRQHFQNWIAYVYPDDRQVGALLTEVLIDLQPEPGAQILAVGGNSASLSAVLREQGLRQVLKARGSKLNRHIYTEWEDSQTAVTALLKRYPETKLIWTASDLLAFEAMDSAKSVGLTPGEDVLIGGVDWSEQALAEIKRGRLAVSVGGHVLDAAEALILLYDHHNGVDRGREVDYVFHTQMAAMTAANVNEYEILLASSNWQKIDFRSFSSVHKASPPKFGVESILQLFLGAEHQ